MNVAQVFTIDKEELTDATFLGRLSHAPMEQIAAGIKQYL